MRFEVDTDVLVTARRALIGLADRFDSIKAEAFVETRPGPSIGPVAGPLLAEWMDFAFDVAKSVDAVIEMETQTQTRYDQTEQGVLDRIAQTATRMGWS